MRTGSAPVIIHSLGESDSAPLMEGWSYWKTYIYAYIYTHSLPFLLDYLLLPFMVLDGREKRINACGLWRRCVNKVARGAILRVGQSDFSYVHDMLPMCKEFDSVTQQGQQQCKGRVSFDARSFPIMMHLGIGAGEGEKSEKAISKAHYLKHVLIKHPLSWGR